MAETHRRSFLRHLVALPLIGGGVTLIGRPTSAAVPVTLPLAETYLGWLRLEHCHLMHELVDRVDPPGHMFSWQSHMPHHALPNAPDLIGAVSVGLASSRAAVMLSTAGVNLQTCDTSACSGLAEAGYTSADPINEHGRRERFDPFKYGLLGDYDAYKAHVFAGHGLAVRS